MINKVVKTKFRRRALLLMAEIKEFLFPSIIQKYVLSAFINIFFICLFASVGLFLVFDLFERIDLFIRESVSFSMALNYMFYKIPLILQLMMPVATLVATLFAIGRLSQSSEITAMRAVGTSLFYILKPLLVMGLLLSLIMFLNAETIVPNATQKLERIYHFDIKKKAEKGTFSRSNFWHREKNKFYNFGLYDSKTTTLKNISIYELDKNFSLDYRTDANEANWGGDPNIGWIMKDVIETSVDRKGNFNSSTFKLAPLLINQTPEDLYKLERNADTLSYFELKSYIKKLSAEGVPVTNYLLDLAAKISFPLINLVVILISFPLALTPARSGNLSLNLALGVLIGFGYYVLHAISISFGNAELIPITAAAWTANILFLCLGGYLIMGMEEK